MACEEVKLLILKAENECISNDKKEILKNHLVSCKECREFYNFSKEFKSSVKESINSDFKLPDTFSKAVIKRNGKNGAAKGIITLAIAAAFLVFALGINDVMHKDVIKTPNAENVSVENI